MIAERHSALALLVGLAVSTGYPIGITASVLMPALALRAESRGRSYKSALSYYAGALWPLIPAAKNFFGPHVPLVLAVSLWAVAALLLALPWLLVWSADVRQALWRAPVGLALTAIPPLGIISWASPLTAAGFLFPATRWCGLFGCALLTGGLAVWPKRTTFSALAVAGVANLIHPTEPRPPTGWKVIDTHFGPIAHHAPEPLAEYRAAEEIQQEALDAQASVIVFPETVVPYWTASTDEFWEQTLAELTASGKTILVGARVPTAAPASHRLYDFRAELAVLQDTSAAVIPPAAHYEQWSPPYFNAVVIRGAQTAVFKQRIPVPIAMWNPFKPDSAPLNLGGRGVLPIRSKRAAILICYEQLIVWPVVSAMLNNSDVLVGVANDYWAAGTTIPRFQRSAIQSWARLFRIPYVLAVNM